MNRLVATSWIVVALALLAFCAVKLRLGTNITHFMPDHSRSELGAVASRLADSPFSRTMVLSLGADALPTAIAAAGELAGALRAHPEVAWVRASVDATQIERGLGHAVDQARGLILTQRVGAGVADRLDLLAQNRHDSVHQVLSLRISGL